MSTQKNRRFIAMAAAIGSTALLMLPAIASAQQSWTVSTSGATAVGAFTRTNNNANSPASGTVNRGTLAVGSSFTLGTTNYAVTSSNQFAGIFTGGTGEATVAQDRFQYQYRESGSIQGILDLVDSNGLLTTTGNVPTRPGDPRANLFLWSNGSRWNSTSVGFSSGATPNTIAGTPAGTHGYQNGRNYTSSGTPEVVQNGQELVRIAWSDVKFNQGFAVNGSRLVTSTPTAPGYGLGPGKIGEVDFQALRNASVITGGTDPSTTRLRNEDLATIPFNLVANPGTGLRTVTKTEGAFLQAVGRLPNGLNLNSVTREIGSGTRNQGANNLGVDPSFGGGERDRRYTGTTNLTGALFVDNDGNAATITPGGEQVPTLGLDGTTTQTVNENRISPVTRFSDKISGSSGTRATVVASRLGVGILSGGDSRDASNGSALTINTGGGAPIRALFIDWENSQPATQATVQNILGGTYFLWSTAQAITVAPYTNPSANDLLPGNEHRPINGDVNDQSVGNPTTNAQPGVHRKFLDNIVRSLPTLQPALTPADFIVNAGFIPPQILTVSKGFDGGAVTLNPVLRPGDPDPIRGRLSDVDPDGAGAGASAAALYDQYVADSTDLLRTQTDWAEPRNMNGNLGVNTFYRIYATANTSTSAGAQNRTITITARTNLAGDFNNDTVRDLSDVPDLTLAYANPAAYLATANGSGVLSTSTGANASPNDGLIVLSDFNSNGNVTVDSNSASFATTPIERADVEFFLRGLAIDTSAFVTAEAKREDGVRSGLLRKNAAFATFNANLDSYVGTVTNAGTGTFFTQTEVNKLKFDAQDVNGSGTRNFAGLVPAVDGNDYNYLVDAFAVDKFAGENPANLVDSSEAFLPQPVRLNNGSTVFVNGPFNLYNAKLVDNGAVIGQADVDVLNNNGLKGQVDQAWAGSVAKTGSLTVVAKPTSGTVTVAAGAGLTVSAGNLTVNGNSPVGQKSILTPTSGSNFLSASVTGTGSLKIDHTIADRNNGSIAPVTVLNSLTVAGGLVNLTTSDLIIKDGTTAAALNAAVGTYLTSGGVSGLGTDSVISGKTSFTATGFTGLAVFDNNDSGSPYYSTYNGVALDASDVIVKFTFWGDLNVDGDIDGGDLATLIETLSTTGVGNYQAGDLNYDGLVNVADLNRFFLTQSNASVFGGGSSFGDGNANGPVGGAIPEPSALGLLVAALPLVSRRRRA